jgi:hypothetical protein
MATSSGQPPLAKSIEAARQKQWVLLVAAPTPTNKQPDFQEQKKLLTAVNLQERNVLVIYLPHGELVPNEELYLHQHCGLQLKGFEVVLIGKAGNISLRSTQALAPELLFSTIDKLRIAN